MSAVIRRHFIYNEKHANNIIFFWSCIQLIQSTRKFWLNEKVFYLLKSNFESAKQRTFSSVRSTLTQQILHKSNLYTKREDKKLQKKLHFRAVVEKLSDIILRTSIPYKKEKERNFRENRLRNSKFGLFKS